MAVRPSIVIAGLSLTLSAAAVAGARWLNSPVREIAEAIASPGEFLWWATAGGVFSGYPSGLAGTLVSILGSASFWFVIGMLLAAMAARRRASKRLK